LPPIRVAVNVSGIQLGLGDFAAQVSAVLAKTGLDAQYLEIEITESVMIGGDEKVTESLEKLHRQGVRLALDDFGTGFSSLSYVNEIDFDLLKIDQSFVRKITSEPKAAAIARLTISMAQTMQVTAIAEGVEDEGQLRFLRKLHCGQLQGFLFSPAVPASELEAMLAAGGRFSAYAESEEESGRTLLCVDDEPSVLSSLRRIFRSEGYKTLLASSGQEALELLASNDVQVILADQRMPEMTGTEFFSRVKELYPTTIRVMLSGYAEIDSLTEAVNSGAIFRFLTKPWDSEQLKEQVKLAFTTHEKLNR
jgi:CheY-like chemotaxis protein